jgi:hypothetical protein
VFAVLAAAFAAYLALRPPPARPAAATVRSSLVLPADFAFAPTDRPLCLSPDGDRLVLVGGRASDPQQLWIRSLSSVRLQPLPGSEGATYPFWSPDGRELAFFADGKLKRMPASGGAVTTVCASESSRGGSWSARGEIVFSPTPFGPLLRVPAAGGSPLALTHSEGRQSHRLPQFLPDGRQLLYTRTNTEQNGIWLLDLDSHEERCVLGVETDAHYAEPGVLLFVRGETLLSQPFDLERFELTGEARVVVEQVQFNPYRATGAYSISRSGEVVYDPPTILRQLQWFDIDGGAGARLGTPARYENVYVSDDGRRVAAFIGREGDARDLWILDAERGLRSKLAEDVATGGRMWFPDPGHVMYARREDTADELFVAYRHPLDGGQPAVEYHGAWACDISPDGVWMLLGLQRPGTNFDILCRRVDGSDEPSDFVAMPSNENYGMFSADGKWVAFSSDATGRDELYLAPFPGPGPLVQLSSEGLNSDESVAWLADGRLIYRDAIDSRRLWALEIDTTTTPPRIGDAVALRAEVELERSLFAISHDGKRLLVAVPADGGDLGVVHLIQNGLKAE